MNMKKILCGLTAVLMIFSATACRSEGTQTTEPAMNQPSMNQPSVNLPEGEGIEDLNLPVEDIIETTEPIVPESTESAPDETVSEETIPDETETPEAPSEAPAETTEPDDVPEIQVTEPEQAADAPTALTYEAYLAMTPAEQQAHYESFASLEAYIAWHNAAKRAYEESQNVIVATGPIDLGDYIEP